MKEAIMSLVFPYTINVITLWPYYYYEVPAYEQDNFDDYCVFDEIEEHLTKPKQFHDWDKQMSRQGRNDKN